MTEIEDQLLSEIKELLGDGLARNYHTLSVVYRMESALQANNNNNNPDCKVVTNGINGDTNGIDPQTGFPIKKRRIKNLGPPVRPQCSECGKDFSNRSALSKHKLIHSDERKFACNICAKAFKRQDHLNGHMLTHRDKKPFECDVEGCEKTYCDARSLRRHKENHHANNVQVSVLQGGNWSQELNQLLSGGAGAVNSNSGTTNGNGNATTNNNSLMTINVSKIYPHSPHHHYNNYNNNTTTTTTTTTSTTTTTTTTNSITTTNHHQNYQIHSHSVPNTPTNLNPLLSPAVPHQISTHANHFNQSLPCTPTQTNSFSFSPHQVQQYHQQQASLPSTPTDNQMQLSFPAQPQPNSVSYSSPSYNNMTPNNPSNVPVFNYPPPSELPPTTPTTPITPTIPSNGQQQGQPSLQPIYEEMNYDTNEETSVIVNGHDVNFVNFEVESLIEQISTDHEQEHHDQQHHHHHHHQQPQHKKQKNTQNSTNYTQQVSSSHLDATQQQQSSDHSDQLVLSTITKSQQSFFPNDDLDAQSLDGPSVNYNLIDHHNQRTHHLNQQHQQHLLSQHLSTSHHSHHSQHLHQQQVQQQLQHQQHQQTHHSQQTAAIQFNRHHHHHHHHHHHNQQAHQLHNHHLHQQQHSQHSQQHSQQHHHHQPHHQQPPPHPLPSITITNTSSPPSTTNEGPINRGRSGKGLNVHRGKSESFVEAHYVQSNLFKEVRKDKETIPDTISRISSCINSTTTSATPVIESTSVFNSSSGTTSTKVDENELMESTSCSLVTSTSNHTNPNYNNNNHSNINTNNTEIIHINNVNSNTASLTFSSDLLTPRSTLRSSSSNLVINLSPEETKDIDEEDDEDDEDADDDDTFSGNNGKDEHIGVSYDEDDDDEDEEDEDDDVFINPAIISPVTSPKSNNQSISNNHLKDNNFKSISSNNNSNNNLTITSNSQSVNCSPLHTSVITNKNSVIKVTPVNDRSSPKRPKHKPEPLYIPPHVNAFGQYASRLRSPRLWDPTGLHSLPSHDVNKSSPPPYTPPPMLSPLRKGSGLYWAIISSGNATPKSATLGNYINARKSLSQTTSVVEPPLSVVNLQINDSSANINASATSSDSTTATTTSHHNANNSTINSTSTIIHNNINSTNNNVNVIIKSNNFKEIFPKSSELIFSSTPTTAYEPDSPYNLDLLPSESDIQPHVNIGSSYQASIPAFIGDKIDVSKRYRRERADLVWNPIVLDKLNQPEDLDFYLELACSSCVPGAGRNIEFALHLLNICNGDLEEAISKLLSADPIKLKSDHPLIDYQYPESDVWTQDEINLYYQALIKFDKDFNAIAQKVETKTVKECIQFYYLWKKICPEEYKRLRIVRRRKEQEGLFYSNPVVTKEEETEDNDVDNKSAADGDDDALSIDSPMNASPSSVSSTATAGTPVGGGGGVKSKDKSGLFPCRVCGKVFSKVKSRSAHMKVHGAGAAANPAYSSASK